ncbi:uncharacterized protein V1510DRAFT_432212 [Dipodascopsis tothii]|uniref:uncharacterized protein n=1 Tax=Dipodascopsis tothii TaxID=44089 RepID=UPI0034CE5662
MDKPILASFTALNIEEDDLDNEQEARIREVQIEESLKILQKALKAHYARDWDGAAAVYDELFQGDIFADTATEIPPTMHALKYLVYKNHGQLVLDWTKLSLKELDTDQAREHVQRALLEFVEAMAHESGDTNFWLHMATFLPALNVPRATRYALECVINDQDRLLVVDEDSDTAALGVDDLAGIYALRQIVADLKDNYSLASPLFRVFDEDRFRNVSKMVLQRARVPDWVQPLVLPPEKLATVMAETQPEPTPVVTTAATWAALAKALVRAADDALSLDGPDGHVRLTLAADAEPMDEDPPDEAAVLSPSDGTDAETEEPAETGSAEPAEPPSRRKRRSFNEEVVGARSSKRVRARVELQQAVQEQEAESDNEFFLELERLFASLGLAFGEVRGVIAADAKDVAGAELYLKDFSTMIQAWDDDKARTLLDREGIQDPASNATKFALLSFTTTHELSGDRPVLADAGLAAFCARINAGAFLLAETAVESLRELLAPAADADRFLDLQWPASLVGSTKRLAAVYYADCMSAIHEQNKAGDAAQALANACWAEALFEVLLDECLDLFQSSFAGDDDGRGAAAFDAAKARVVRWHEFMVDAIGAIGDGASDARAVVELRYMWASILLYQMAGYAEDVILDMLDRFKSALATFPDSLTVVFANTASIPDISVECVDAQISKLRISAVFSSIFEPSSEKIDLKIAILEYIMKGERAHADLPEFDLHIVQSFIGKSSLEFQLYLWNLLREGYEHRDQQAEAFECLLRSLQLVVADVRSPAFEDADADRRQFMVLRCLAFAQTYLDAAAAYALRDAPDPLADFPAETLLAPTEALVALVRLLNVFVVHADFIQNAGTEFPLAETPAYRNSAARVQDMLIQSWCVLYLFAKKRAAIVDGVDAAEFVLALLGVLHEELGNREYCSLAGGIFLKLLQGELLALDPAAAENELLQCLHCRYGFALGNEAFFPYEHNAENATFDRREALVLVEFVMSLALRKRPAQTLPRSDLKSTLDNFCEVIGVPRRDQSSIYYNQSIVEAYLGRSLEPLLLADAAKGTLALSTMRVQSDYARVARIGLYFMQGQIYLAQYRSRKRTMAGRTEDLDYAIRYFKHDLVCNTNRFEAWYGLAQTYDSLAEDDMTWSAEKLNNDHRRAIVAAQRKAILCYAIATSLHIQQEALEPTKSVLASFWTDFGYEIYASTRPPLEMDVYNGADSERHYSGADGMYTGAAHSTLRVVTAYRLALRLFRTAAVGDPDDWRNYYMQGKLLKRLGQPPRRVLRMYLRAMECAEDKQSQGDPIFEPHYKLISSVYKYLRSGDLSEPEADLYLDKSEYCDDGDSDSGSDDDGDTAMVSAPSTPVPSPPPSPQRIYAKIIGMLQNIKAADKKKWHHRPSYRTAVIRVDIFGDVAKAKEEIGSFFSLKPGSKSFAAIWRPEFERAGRHFVYVHYYTKFYIMTLERTNDLDALSMMTRRLRRLSSAMVRHTETWECLCTALINVLRNLADVREKFIDSVLSLLTVDDFMRKALRLEYVCSRLSPPPPLVKYLSEASELRKLNSGLAPIVPMEDVFGSIYMKLYQSLPELEARLAAELPAEPAAAEPDDPASSQDPSAPEVPSRSKTARVTRKELHARANALLRPANAEAPARPTRERRETQDDSGLTEATSSAIKEELLGSAPEPATPVAAPS